MIATGAAGGRKAEILERAFDGRSLWVDARRRLLRNRAAMASMIGAGDHRLDGGVGAAAVALRL